MKCDSCGREFDGPGVPTIRSRGGFYDYWMNKNLPVTICPECAESRRRLPRYIFLAIISIVAVLLFLSMLWQ